MKSRRRSPDWVASKDMRAAIQRELVPAALELGWVVVKQRPIRKEERWFGSFDFERVNPDRIEHLGFDFQYGEAPDIWLSLALWTGEAGVCTLFRTGGYSDPSTSAKPFWRGLLRRFHRSPRRDLLGLAIARGRERLLLAEAYFREGPSHPRRGWLATLPPYRWPDGYDERLRALSGRAK